MEHRQTLSRGLMKWSAEMFFDTMAEQIFVSQTDKKTA